MYAGYDYALDSWRIREHSNVTSDGPPVYQFKAIIPIAGTLVMLQGLAEIMRCIVCLKTGQWPERLKDAEEIDVVEQQLAKSAYVDEESRERAIGTSTRSTTPRGSAAWARAAIRNYGTAHEAGAPRASKALAPWDGAKRRSGDHERSAPSA